MNIIDLLDVMKESFEAIKEDNIAPSDIDVVVYDKDDNYLILDRVQLRYDYKHETGVLAFKIPEM